MSTYIRELSGALVPELRVPLAAIVQADAVGVLAPGIEAIVRPVTSGARRALLGLWPVTDALLVHGLDVDLPVRCTVPTVSTVHDLSVFDVPWAFSRYRAVGERALVGRSIRRADAVIGVSAFTAGRVAALLGRVASVIHEAPATTVIEPSPAEVVAVRARYALPSVFVLHVGTVEPRKDIPTLAEACRQADVPLVLAGRVSDPGLLGPGARSLGFVDSADIPRLYAAATVVAYPSLYEGFGLPPLEAMAVGAAVVATDAGSLPEVLGDGALLVAPGNAASLAAAITTLVVDTARRDALVARGRRRARAFSWAAAARATAQVYRSLGVDC